MACKFRSHQFFCDLPRPAMEAFEAIKRAADYPAHSLLFLEGIAPRGIYLLCQGRAKLSMTSATGKTLLLKFVKEGEILGLHAAMSDRPYDATAEIVEPSRVAFVSQNDFLRFLRQHGEACLRAARFVSESCHDAYDQMRSIGLAQTAAEKLARLILEWSGDGEETGQGIRIEMRLTQEEIAQLIGATRETVNRLFARFGIDDLIRIHGSTLWIRKPSALATLVNT